MLLMFSVEESWYSALVPAVQCCEVAFSLNCTLNNMSGQYCGLILASEMSKSRKSSHRTTLHKHVPS